jgi:hypothetical protein
MTDLVSGGGDEVSALEGEVSGVAALCARVDRLFLLLLRLLIQQRLQIHLRKLEEFIYSTRGIVDGGGDSLPRGSSSG